MKTVNIDLDAFTNDNPMTLQNTSQLSYSQTPMAGQSQPFNFGDRPHTTANFNNKESNNSVSIDNQLKQRGVDSESLSDNHADEKPPSEMPNEYTNLTQGYDALVFST